MPNNKIMVQDNVLKFKIIEACKKVKRKDDKSTRPVIYQYIEKNNDSELTIRSWQSGVPSEYRVSVNEIIPVPNESEKSKIIAIAKVHHLLRGISENISLEEVIILISKIFFNQTLK